MAEGRLPKTALKWMPKQKRAGGRPKKNWMEGIRKAMDARNLNEEKWEDRKQWSLGVGHRRKTFRNRYIHTPHNNQMYVYTHRHIMKWHISYRTNTVHVLIQGCTAYNA